MVLLLAHNDSISGYYPGNVKDHVEKVMGQHGYTVVWLELDEMSTYQTLHPDQQATLPGALPEPIWETLNTAIAEGFNRG